MAMPRFSAKTKELWDALTYQTDIDKAESLLKELIEIKNPLDIAFGKLFITHHYLAFQQHSKLLEILEEVENENKRLEDNFITFMVNSYYFRYYIGFNSPIVSKEQSEKYLEKMELAYQDIDYKDNWEKYYCTGRYYSIKADNEWKMKDEISNAIEFQRKCIESWSKIPEDGEYYSAHAHINLGLFYRESGNLEEAENSFNQALNASKIYNNRLQLWALFHLSNLNFLRGDLQKATELNGQRLDLAKRLDSIFGIYWSLSIKGFYLYQNGNYDEAIKAYQESLVYRKQHNDPKIIFDGYYEIFKFYYQRFKITKDKSFFNQAEQILPDLLELSKLHSENKIIVNYTNYLQSLILKYGNFRKKSRAIDIFEELIEFYPNDISISLEYLELLFNDVIQSEDQDIINLIDELMVKISKIPLRNNPQAIFGFISQQIFHAKYNYYIKGDISLALKILIDSKSIISNYKLDNLVKEINTEIKVLNNEITKWDNVDISVLERIKTSEFSKYIQQALEIASKQ